MSFIRHSTDGWSEKDFDLICSAMRWVGNASRDFDPHHGGDFMPSDLAAVVMDLQMALHQLSEVMKG